MIRSVFSVLSLIVLLSFHSTTAWSEDGLETDDKFFKGIQAGHDDDDLDRVTKKSAVIQTLDQTKKTDNAVKDEFNTASPGVMKPYEAAAMDNAVLAENKRRRNAIIQKIAAGTPAVQQCLDAQKSREYKKAQITLAWLVDASGRVLQAEIKKTDIENLDVQKCIYNIAMKMNFKEAATKQYKKSLVEYTYNISVRPRSPASVHKARPYIRR